MVQVSSTLINVLVRIQHWVCNNVKTLGSKLPPMLGATMFDGLVFAVATSEIFTLQIQENWGPGSFVEENLVKHSHTDTGMTGIFDNNNTRFELGCENDPHSKNDMAIIWWSTCQNPGASQKETRLKSGGSGGGNVPMIG
ncbi:hypothetical protein MTR_3g086390 [Medicago truncatula]|uniref:Uncharacterized protein n=1 Tax=Medicago truncatula TaxID=3880 RepID=G7J337_MEDTR|nr:hypothetical protein MTR_3g086390 [Medicago truncatula]